MGRVRAWWSLLALIALAVPTGAAAITPLPPAVLNTNASIDAGEDSNVSVATDGAGNWVAVWHSGDDLGGTIGADLDILVARSTDAGATWTDAAPLDAHFETDAGDDRNCVVVPTQGAGNWLAVWQSSDDLGATIGTDWDVLASQSTDNGASWSTPVAVNLDAATDGSDSDGDSLEMVTDGAGTVVVTWSSDKNLGGTLGTDADILFVRSTNNGANWSSTAALNTNADSDSVEDSSHAPLATDGADKWVAIWGSEEDLGAGFGTNRNVLVSRSSDGGASWTAPQLLHEHLGTDSANEVFSGSLVTDGSGNWVAAWHSADDLGGTIGDDVDILVSRSTNNGASWTTPAALNPNADTYSGVDKSPGLATDGAGNWLAVWQSRDDLGGTIAADWDILVARSTDNGASWTGLQAVDPDAENETWLVDTRPRVVTDSAGNWVATWNAYDVGSETISYDGDILVSRSSDNGASWTAPAALNSNATSDSGNDWRQFAATDGAGNWVAVWHSSEDLGGTLGTDLDILTARSSDNGATWTAPQALHSHFANDEKEDNLWGSLITDGAGNWWVAWRSLDDYDDVGLSLGTSDWDVLISRSTDNGATWSTPAPVNNDAGSDTADDGWGLVVATDGAGTLVATWCSGKTLGGTIGADWDLIFTRSTNYGVDWSNLAALNTNAASDSGGEYSRSPLATDGAGNWVIIWSSAEDLESTGDNDLDHFVARSSDNGATWTDPEYLHDYFKTDDPSVSEEYRGWLATDGAGTWVATWMSYDQLGLPIGGDHEIVMSRSTDNGATWTRPAPLNANATTDTSQVDWSPFVVADGNGNWVTVWHSYDYSNGPLGGDGDILVALSTDDGVSWTYPAPLNTNAYSDFGTDSGAHLATDAAGNWLATWTSGDDLDGTIGTDWDLLYTTFRFHIVDSTGDAGDFSTGDGVCDTDDGAGDGPCTLRAAIEQANADSDFDNIVFDIDAATDAGCNAGTGVCTIQPASALPSITQPVAIDGYTQGGASPNINPPESGSNAVLKIEIDGTSAGASTDGLDISAGGTTIKGLAINSFDGHGIRLDTNGGNFIEGNFIGTDVTGAADLGNGLQGIRIEDAPDNAIGGTTPEARNVISGNDEQGVRILGSLATGNLVKGNYIGTNAAGTADLGNGAAGVTIVDAPGNTIGGTESGARNVISGNDDRGVHITYSSATGNLVQGNYIGTNAAGSADLGNSSHGVAILEAPGNTIGGTTPGARNVISGNDEEGININDVGATGNLVLSNYIGTNAEGDAAVSNGGNGVRIRNGATGNTVGGTTPGGGNIIAFNTWNGVCVLEDPSTGNPVRGNSIHSNTLLGIDLAPTGQDCSTGTVTANDAGDPDTGPNALMNFPVITSASYDAVDTTISGSLDTADPANATVDVYASDATDGLGYAEGRAWLGSTTAPGGSWTLVFSGPSPHIYLSATATDSSGNTSEFSAVPETDGDSDGVADLYETNTGIYVSPTNTGSDPGDPDSDDDNLDDGTEIGLGTDPNDADSDDDGLDDDVELGLGTDPTDADSDDDGLEDGEEVALGTDPNDPDTDDDDVCDGGNTVGGTCDTAGPDNCPFVGNPGQEDSDFLPAGDACQCGDIDGDFHVYSSDLVLAREHLMGKAIAGDITRCNVVGAYAPTGDGSDCDVADIALLTRYIAGETVTLGNVCKPYFEGP